MSATGNRVVKLGAYFFKKVAEGWHVYDAASHFWGLVEELPLGVYEFSLRLNDSAEAAEMHSFIAEVMMAELEVRRGAVEPETRGEVDW